ncbi:hypothetical protein [Paenibacillus taichungensis]|uniref:hypothetical protein n=1 Tax=Paenibacillus taichungensis TaxID=484184 RepID=UPI0039A6BC26
MSDIHPLRHGDKVVMHTCDEANFADYHGRIWTCGSNEWVSGEGVYAERHVILDDWLNGPFLTKYLQKVNVEG